VARIIQGFEELQANLLRLKEGVAKNAMRHATRKAAEIVRQEAESRAPVGTVGHKTYLGRSVAPGFLSRNVQKIVYVDRRRGVVRAEIGPTAEAFYGSQFVELGVPSRGIAARPWLGLSLAANIGNAEQEFTFELRKAIRRAIKRGAVK
jgi:HK97 gp10 family phage protein